MRASFLSFLALAALAAPTSAGVWVVSQSGAGDFSELSEAVAAAAEGDTIWVRDGDFGPVVIADKALTIASIEPDRVHVAGIDITGLAAGKVVTISGLGIYRTEFPPGGRGAVAIDACAGSVRLVDCTLGRDGTPGIVSHKGAGLSAFGAADVALVDCALRGVSWGNSDIDSGAGLVLRNSRMSLYGCSARGAAWSGTSPDTGSAGALLEDAFLFASSSRIEGGGNTDYYACHPIDGGNGLETNGHCTLYLLDSTILPGVGGESYCTFGQSYYGDWGALMLLSPETTLERLPSSLRKWWCPNVSFSGETLRVHYLGSRGDTLHLVRGTVGGFDFQRETLGTWLLSPPTTASTTVGVAVDGTLSIDFPLADLDAPAGEGAFLLQAYVVTAKGQSRWLGPGSALVLDRERTAPFLVPIHVDASAQAGGDGATWGTAFDRLQDGLEAARLSWIELPVVREVWIAGGTYVPPFGGHERFNVYQPTRIHGGFAGDESSLEQRELGAHPTVLSADQNGDDGPGFQNYGENNRRVLVVHTGAVATTVLDGLTLRGASGSGNVKGGGLLLLSGGDARVTNCTFEENLAGVGAGAALSFSLWTYGFADFIDCTFRNNRAFYSGGGAEVEWGASLVNCEFLMNEASTMNGGGLSAWAGGWWPVLIQGCRIAENSAALGGGLYLRSNTPQSIRVRNSTIDDNVGSVGPGGVYAEGNSPDIRNSILWGNSSNGAGGVAAQLSPPLGAEIPPRYCCIEGWAGEYGGEGNIAGDPLLQPDGGLGAGSAAIDAGDNSAVASDSADLDGDGLHGEPVPIDLAGNPRFVDDPAIPDSGVGPAPVVDMGARERQP